jgi:hypothetical protein
MSAIESLLNRLEEKMVSPDEEVRPETVNLS